MARHTLRRMAPVLLLLMALLPLAGLVETCGDCFAGEAPGCCPPACSLCVACCKMPSALSTLPAVGPSQGDTGWAPPPGDAFLPSAGPHDIFHVPKPFLV